MYKAIEEHDIDSETIASIGQFAVLWGMVEERYFDRCCNAKKLNNLIVAESDEELEASADAIRDALLDYYDIATVIMEFLCMRENDNGFYKYVESFLLDEEIEAKNKNKVLASICLCFRIRNNLFHGEKVFDLLNRQRVLIEACSAFLNESLMIKGVFQKKN